MTSSATLIVGGTFNPVHLGHLNIVNTVQQHFHFNPCLFLPSHLPVHKKMDRISPEQRVQMLKLALHDFPIEHAELCLEEINHPTPSYTYHTLCRFRKTVGASTPLVFLMGDDAFRTLSSWYQHEQLLTLTHFLVVKRHDTTSSHALCTETILPHPTPEAGNDKTMRDALFLKPCGSVIFFDAGHYPISSQDIRACVHRHAPYQQNVTPSVAQYIDQEHLYIRLQKDDARP